MSGSRTPDIGARRLRKATHADVDRMLSLKEALAIHREDGEVRRGGFLLGSSREKYGFLLQHGHGLVLEDAGERLIGFSITLPDRVLRASELWERRAHIRWEGAAPAEFERGRVGYFDQLATRPLPGEEAFTGALALRAVRDLFRAGHDFVFATVVIEPVKNLAPLSMLGAMGARRVGVVEESYEGVGNVVSALFCIDPTCDRTKPALFARMTRLGDRLSES